MEDVEVAFMPRHGDEHSLPPHRINYRANVWAMKEVGVRRMIGPCACGSLRPELAPGTFVICDQFVDRTHARESTRCRAVKATDTTTTMQRVSRTSLWRIPRWRGTAP